VPIGFLPATQIYTGSSGRSWCPWIPKMPRVAVNLACNRIRFRQFDAVVMMTGQSPWTSLRSPWRRSVRALTFKQLSHGHGGLRSLRATAHLLWLPCHAAGAGAR